MPRWEGCMKIHEGCGGLCKWVEAIETPGVGYYGKCMACQTNRIVVEQMIPITKAKVEAGVLLDNDDPDKLSDIKWDSDLDWEENQKRLKEQIQDKL